MNALGPYRSWLLILQDLKYEAQANYASMGLACLASCQHFEKREKDE